MFLRKAQEVCSDRMHPVARDLNTVLIPYLQGSLFRLFKGGKLPKPKRLNPLSTGKSVQTTYGLGGRKCHSVLIPYLQGSLFRLLLLTLLLKLLLS